MGSMGFVQPMRFLRKVPEPMDFEQIVQQTRINSAIQ